jgi:glycosyltransferase involved in cell wall biosynthesis
VKARSTKRIAFVTDEILGLAKSAGAATANTFLALALADLGHEVEIRFAAPMRGDGVAAPWRDQYDTRGIAVQAIEPFPVPVAPAGFRVTCAVERSLRRDAPDVVICDDRYGSAFASVRMRTLGLEFERTMFVIYCHGTTAWIADAQQKVRRRTGSFEVEALERAAIELADVVVSPSAYMLDWMRDRGWRLPRALVAPLLTRSAIGDRTMDDPLPSEPVRRIAFFGRLEERKGLQPFLAALNAIGDDLLGGKEVLFVGKETPVWTVDRVRASLSPSTAQALAAVRFETGLDQPEAIALLRQPGTLAVMPSLVDNSPMVIYECLEHGIPFLASSEGGGPELVASEDRPRSFVEPTADRLAERLVAILSGHETLVPAHPGFDAEEILHGWESAITQPEAPRASPAPARTVTAVVRRSGRAEELERCLHALREQSRPPDRIEVIDHVAGLGAPTEDFLFALADVDEPDRGCLETLLQAQSVCGADVVTCAFHCVDEHEGISLFLGDPGALGAIANYYGLAGLYRRDMWSAETESDWLTLAARVLAGARVVSVPRPLVRSSRVPEDASSAPETALRVVEAFERAGPPSSRGLATLAASLAARAEEPVASPSLSERARWILATEGARGLLRRARRNNSSREAVRADSPQ